MYNLIVGSDKGTLWGSRMLEIVPDTLRKSMNNIQYPFLKLIPALVMPELNTNDEQVARLGRITDIRESRDEKKDIKFKFDACPNLPPIPTKIIESLAEELGIESPEWTLHHTAWSVLEADPYDALFRNIFSANISEPTGNALSQAVHFPRNEAREPSLVAVMMPFSKEFDIVYRTIESAAIKAGMHCVRVDDIWEHDHIMTDVASLLWKAEVVIADLTGRNPNVFYEVGLAHGITRKTILLTQNRNDVPFDLNAIRYLHYSIADIANTNGARLQHDLKERLETLTQGR